MAEKHDRQLDDIGQEMVNAGLISVDQLAVAQETKKNLGGDLGRILIRKGFVTEEQISKVRSRADAELSIDVGEEVR